jgi:hypothetical protein
MSLQLPDDWHRMSNHERRLHVALHATEDPMVKAALRQRLTGRPRPNGHLPGPARDTPPKHD